MIQRPNLNMDNPDLHSGPAQLSERGPLQPTADPRGANTIRPNGTTSSHRAQNSANIPRQESAFGSPLRPRTAGQLSGAYDELYRDHSNTNLAGGPSNNVQQSLHRSRAINLQRARSDFGPRREILGAQQAQNEDDAHRMRHGWEEEYTSDEWLSLLSSVGNLIHERKLIR